MFKEAKPKSIIITTPNIEYNANYQGLFPGAMRHGDHRFEWTREEFETWAEKTAGNYGYSVKFEGIGEADIKYGCPTQMAVFSLE